MVPTASGCVEMCLAADHVCTYIHSHTNYSLTNTLAQLTHGMLHILHSCLSCVCGTKHKYHFTILHFQSTQLSGSKCIPRLLQPLPLLRPRAVLPPRKLPPCRDVIGPFPLPAPRQLLLCFPSPGFAYTGHCLQMESVAFW